MDSESETRRNCPVCGAFVSPEATRCPNGHDCAWSFSNLNFEALGDSILDSIAGSPGQRGGKPQFDTIFECYRCSRLVESQRMGERFVVPRYCPWCGDPVCSMLGRELDGYRITEVISQGGFGVVYLASNLTQPAMKSVVKVLRPDIGYYQPDFIRVFVEEARVTEAIGQTCWNIVRVSNVRQEPWPYFFMEYIRGPTLEQFIATTSRKTLPIRECVGYLRGIARALVVTHARGRIHRDLKPLNIMVIRGESIAQPEERIKMLDFGLAMKIVGRDVKYAISELSSLGPETQRLNESSPVRTAGTPEYMAPESFDGVGDCEADIYSFGVTAYELLTGRRPWKDPPASLDRQTYWTECHKQKPPTPIRQVRPQVPNWLSKVVMGCLEKDPAKRIPSAEELLRRLRAPVSRWVWLVSAAAILLVALLSVLAMRTEVPLDLQWLGTGEDHPGSKITIHVQDAGSLTAKGLQMFLPDDGTGFEWAVYRKEESQDVFQDGFQFKPDGRDPRRVAVLFPGPALSGQLLGASLSIEGRCSGCLKSLVVRGEVKIIRDADPPEVSVDYRYVLGSGSEARPVDLRERQGAVRPRLRPEGCLQVDIKDANIDLKKVLLTVERDGTVYRKIRQKAPLRADEIAAGAAISSFLFPLTGVPEGDYDGYVTASDLAGNTGDSSLSLLHFTVDASCRFKYLGDWTKPYLAKGRAFLKFSSGESLRKIAVTKDGRKTPLQLAYYPAEDICPAEAKEGPLQIIGKLGELPKLVPLSEAPQLQPNTDYFLSFALERDAVSFQGELVAADSALLEPHESIMKLSFSLPPPLQQGDIDRVSIRIRAGDGTEENCGSCDIEAGDLHGVDAANFKPRSFKVACPDTGGTLKGELDMGVSYGRVLRATCIGTGQQEVEARTGDVSESKVTFTNIELGRDQRNEFTVTLYDALERPFVRKLAVFPDTKEPEIQISLISSGKQQSGDFEYHEVSSWKDITLEVKPASGQSALEKVEASIDGGKPFTLRRSGKDGGYRCTLDRLVNGPRADGSYNLEVVATDEAGQEKRETPPLILDSGAPVVEPQGAVVKNGCLLLENVDKVTFAVRDNNGVNLGEGVWSVQQDGDWGPQMKIGAEDSSATACAFTVDLSALPYECGGALKFWIPDGCGKQAEDPESIPFKRSIRWPQAVTFKRMEWIACPHGATVPDFYISRTEVPNELFRNESFIRRGIYLDAELRRSISFERPKYWGTDGSFPAYLLKGARIRGDGFPVVGVSPPEAEAFGKTVFGARLPTVAEWRQAAKMGNPTGRYPWKDVEGAGKYVNGSRAPGEGAGALDEVRTRQMFWNGASARVEHVPVDADPGFPAALVERNPSLRILHQLGNVSELVRRGSVDPKGASYGVVGGDFDSTYRRLDLDAKPLPYDETWRSYRCGFRLVIDVKGKRAPRESQDVDRFKEFQRAARGGAAASQREGHQP